ncbi:MAG: VIT1/CCC1 transporter family protein [Thermoproteota archaeon]
MRFIEVLNKYIEVSEVGEIARRLFIMNGLDGIMTILSILIGSYIGKVSIETILSMVFGASVAMSISGAYGAFVSERSERKRHIKELEKALFSDLDGTVVERANLTAVIIVMVVDSISPLIFSFITIFPLVLSKLNFLSLQVAFNLSFIIGGVSLFVLGLLLGKIAHEHVLVHGLFMVLSGLFVAVIMFLLA